MKHGLFWFVSWLFLGFAAAQDQSELEAALDALQAKIQHQKLAQQNNRARYSEGERQLQELENDISQALKLFKTAHQALSETQREIKRIEVKQSDLRQQQALTQKQLSQQIRAVWLSGTQRKMQLLLNEQDIHAFSRLNIYQKHLNQRQNKLLQSWQMQQEQLKELSAQLEKERQHRSLAAEAEVQSMNRLKSSQKRARKQQIALQGEIQNNRQTLKKLEAEQTDLKVLLETIQTSLKLINTELKRPFKQMKSQMDWPFKGKRLNAFGALRGKDLRWQGIQIKGQSEANIQAIAHGRVVFSDWLRGYGLLLIIDHGDEYLSLYGHNSSLYAEVGEWINSGQTIGKSNLDGLHYFELRKGAQALDPVVWLK